MRFTWHVAYLLAIAILIGAVVGLSMDNASKAKSIEDLHYVQRINSVEKNMIQQSREWAVRQGSVFVDNAKSVRQADALKEDLDQWMDVVEGTTAQTGYSFQSSSTGTGAMEMIMIDLLALGAATKVGIVPAEQFDSRLRRVNTYISPGDLKSHTMLDSIVWFAREYQR